MASPVLCLCKCVLRPIKPNFICRNYSIRPPVSLGGKLWRRRKGLPPEKAKTFEQHFAEKTAVDPDLLQSVNIGCDYQPRRVSRKEKIATLRANHTNSELELAARHRKLQIPLDEVKEAWHKELWSVHVKMIAEHYGIFHDLFFDAHFYPQTVLKVSYDYDDEFVTPVHTGNKILPSEAATEPLVEFDASEEDLFTLVMTNPDGHLTENEAEYLHWFVGNIPGCDVTKGEVICDYLRPFPLRGTGFHRHVFVLYQQAGPINFNKEVRKMPCTSLAERTFQTLEFFREHQEMLTPVGISFFQSEWDDSVTDVYHSVLGMAEPAFEYMHPPYYHPPQVKYPRKQPFNRYYDRYRDRKDLYEEVVKKKLEMITPFAPHPPRPKYPLVQHYKPRINYKPSWLRLQEELMLRRQEQFKDLP